MKIGCDLLKVEVSKLNGMVAFGHMPFGRSALSSLNRSLSSSSSSSSSSPSSAGVSECLLTSECAKCSRCDDDNDIDAESAS